MLENDCDGGTGIVTGREQEESLGGGGCAVADVLVK